MRLHPFCFEKQYYWPYGPFSLKARKLGQIGSWIIEAVLVWPAHLLSHFRAPLYKETGIIKKQTTGILQTMVCFWFFQHLIFELLVNIHLTVPPWCLRNLSHVSITLSSCHDGYDIPSDRFTLVWKAVLGSTFYIYLIKQLMHLLLQATSPSFCKI